MLHASIVGLGINVAAAAVPPEEQLSFPATSLESEQGHPIERLGLLRDIMSALLHWRSQIGTHHFIQSWENALAFRSELVSVGRDGEPALHGTLLGLEADGSLRVMSDNMPTIVHVGEIHLRPSNDRIG